MGKSRYLGSDQLKNENIFMIEIMVEQLNLDASTARDMRSMVAENCIEFSFLDFPSFVICDEEFVPAKSDNVTDGCSGCGPVRNGNSCLFPIGPTLLKMLTKEFDMKVHVYKKLREGSVPQKVYVAQGEISLRDMFNDLVLQLLRKNDSSITKSLKDCYSLQNAIGTHVGELALFIRLSFFGKMIVTKFQMDFDGQSVGYQSKNGTNLYKYTRKEEVFCSAPCGETTSCPFAPKKKIICPPNPSHTEVVANRSAEKAKGKGKGSKKAKK